MTVANTFDNLHATLTGFRVLRFGGITPVAADRISSTVEAGAVSGFVISQNFARPWRIAPLVVLGSVVSGMSDQRSSAW